MSHVSLGATAAVSEGAAPRDPAAMLGSKTGWVPVLAGPRDKKFDEYPDESIAAWHQRLKVEC